jgi:hypothetical protein
VKKLFSLLLLCTVMHQAIAGDRVIDKQLWFGYFQQGRLHKNWGYWLDLQHRLKNDFATNFHQELVRVGATWYAKDNLRLTVGHVYSCFFPSLTNPKFVRSEHRPWQHLQYVYSSKNFRATHALRSEQRFLQKVNGETIADGYVFRLRLRYSYSLAWSLGKKQFRQGSWGIVLTDEVMINAYSNDKSKLFDQNRASAAIAYHITDEIQVHLGYMNLFALTSKGSEMDHCIRVLAYHTIDWRKKK